MAGKINIVANIIYVIRDREINELIDRRERIEGLVTLQIHLFHHGEDTQETGKNTV